MTKTASLAAFLVLSLGSAAEPPEPRLVPRPRQVEYGVGTMGAWSALNCTTCESPALRSEAGRIAEEWGVPFIDGPMKKRDGSLGPVMSLAVDFGRDADAASGKAETGEQGYSLTVSMDAVGDVSVKIAGGDEAGAFYGLQTLRQLVEKREGRLFIKPVVIKDWPAFKRRGFVFGYGDNAHVLRGLDLASRLKLNLFVTVGARESFNFKPNKKDIKSQMAFCAGRQIEMCALLGYERFLEKMPTEQVQKYYEARYKAGFRSFTVNFDDMDEATPEGARRTAQKHAEITRAVCDHLRAIDPSVRFIFCPAPYGGVPGRTGFVDGRFSQEAGVEYLKVIKAGLPEGIPVYWTGLDVWSPQVDMESARLFREAVGRNLFFWDNDTIRFAAKGLPLSGRPADLHTLCDGYMANLNERELSWKDRRKVEETLAAIADYAWNPEAYEESR